MGIEIDELDIYRSKGLPAHMVKRKHYKCLKYIDYIPEIISKPDYIGINPNEQGTSIELVKRYADNVMIGIKLDTDGKYNNNKRNYFEVGNGSRHTLQRVPEMMDTPPILNNYAFILLKPTFLRITYKRKRLF